MGNLHGKTLFISGGSRGIGLAIAKRAAADGANIIIAAKTADPHPKLPGTIYTSANATSAMGYSPRLPRRLREQPSVAAQPWSHRRADRSHASTSRHEHPVELYDRKRHGGAPGLRWGVCNAGGTSAIGT